MFSKLVEPLAVVGYELLVVAAIRNDNVQHGETKRHIRSGFDGIPLVSFGSRDSEPRIEADQTRLPVHRGIDQVHRIGRDEALKPIRACQDHVVGVQQIERRYCSIRHRVRQVDRRQAKRGMADDVGRAESQAEVFEKDLCKGFSGRPEDALRPVLFFDCRQLLRRVVEGFLPGGRAPLAFAACAGADERLLQAVRVVNLEQARVTSRTEHPA